MSKVLLQINSCSAYLLASVLTNTVQEAMLMQTVVQMMKHHYLRLTAFL